MSDLEGVWRKVLEKIQKKTSKANFYTLFKNTQLVSLTASQAIVAAPSAMITDMLQRRFINEIKEALDEATGNDINITFSIKSFPQEKSTPSEPLFAESEEARPMVGHLPRVRPDFTFKNFAVSSSNQLAFVSAQTVAQDIGAAYNPLFIYGPVGVGKTHLMHAIANEVYQKNPQRKIIYITSEEFTNEVVEAIINNETAKMKKRFRSAALLVIDDIQFIEGKEKVQEELFHTFNILVDNGSQICLSSDRPPHEIKKIQHRLSSRFSGGLSVDIEPPDFELKTAIALIKAKKYGQNISIDIAKILAENAKDTRLLEGLLLRVITQSATTGEEITPELALASLGKYVEEKRSQVHSDDIIRCVCEYYRVKPTQLKGPKRDASLVKARQITMYLLKKELGMTYVEIGNLMGGRDHTTVMHGVDKITSLVDSKAIVSEDIVGITSILNR